MSQRPSDELDQLQRQTGLQFQNRELLQEAMTHRSYVNEHDEPGLLHNERLEFLGDSVLGFVVADMLFRRFPEMPEGEMTPLRSALVRKETLAELATQFQVERALRTSRGERLSGGNRRPSVLSDAFEALLGAVYVDQGLEAVRAFLLPLVEPRLERIVREKLHKDARSLLQEWSQANRNVTPHYHTVVVTGPEHERRFTVEVLIGDEVVGQGTAHTKQSAAQAAARDGLKRLVSDSRA